MARRRLQTDREVSGYLETFESCLSFASVFSQKPLLFPPPSSFPVPSFLRQSLIDSHAETLLLSLTAARKISPAFLHLQETTVTTEQSGRFGFGGETAERNRVSRYGDHNVRK